MDGVIMLKNKIKPKLNIADTIPFDTIDKSGVISLGNGRYSKSYRLSDVNYLIARENEQVDIYESWCKFLNSFEAGILVQITIYNRNLDVDNFEDQTMIQETGDSLDKYREDYNKIVMDKIVEGKNTIFRDKYITISIKAKDNESANKTFLRLDREIADNIKKIQGSGISNIESMERLKILHDIYNCGHEDEFLKTQNDDVDTFSILNAVEQGLSIKELIIPENAVFYNKYFKLGDKYCCTLYLSEYASSINDAFFAELAGINYNSILTLNLTCFDQTVARKMVKDQMININSEVIAAQKNASKSGYSSELISPTLMDKQREARFLLDDMTNRNQRLFSTKLLITLYADSRNELNEAIASVRSIGNKHSCILSVYSTLQEDAFDSCLPLGLDLLSENRTITTEAAGVFIPFTSQELMQPNGMYYGVNTISRNLIKYNRLSGTNYNALIFGQPGSGKSFSAKREIMNTYINPTIGGDIIIIDPENEYGPLAKLLGGEVIEIEAGGIHHINPFDLDISYGDEGKDPLPYKQDFILSMMEMILGSTIGITPGQKSILDRASRYTYENLKKHDYDPKYTPTMKDFYNHLVDFANDDAEAYDLAKSLEIYVDGTLNLFAHKTNVNTKSNFIVYNIKGLSDALKPLAMLVIIDNIWNRISINRKLKKPTFLYIDESHLLFQSPQTANFISSLYKRARKYNGAITCITQNTSDILNNSNVGTIIENTSFIEMLSLSYKSSQELARILDISETQMQFVKNTQPGEGLLYIQAGPGSPSGIIPFTDRFPKDSELYKAFNTRNVNF